MDQNDGIPLDESFQGDVRRSRSGRICMPRLAFWAGERIFTTIQAEGNSKYVAPVNSLQVSLDNRLVESMDNWDPKVTRKSSFNKSEKKKKPDKMRKSQAAPSSRNLRNKAKLSPTTSQKKLSKTDKKQLQQISLISDMSSDDGDINSTYVVKSKSTPRLQTLRSRQVNERTDSEDQNSVEFSTHPEDFQLTPPQMRKDNETIRKLVKYGSSENSIKHASDKSKTIENRIELRNGQLQNELQMKTRSQKSAVTQNKSSEEGTSQRMKKRWALLPTRERINTRSKMYGQLRTGKRYTTSSEEELSPPFKKQAVSSKGKSTANNKRREKGKTVTNFQGRSNGNNNFDDSLDESCSEELPQQADMRYHENKDRRYGTRSRSNKSEKLSNASRDKHVTKCSEKPVEREYSKEVVEHSTSYKAQQRSHSSRNNVPIQPVATRRNVAETRDNQQLQNGEFTEQESSEEIAVSPSSNQMKQRSPFLKKGVSILYSPVRSKRNDEMPSEQESSEGIIEDSSYKPQQRSHPVKNSNPIQQLTTRTKSSTVEARDDDENSEFTEPESLEEVAESPSSNQMNRRSLLVRNGVPNQHSTIKSMRNIVNTRDKHRFQNDEMPSEQESEGIIEDSSYKPQQRSHPVKNSTPIQQLTARTKSNAAEARDNDENSELTGLESSEDGEDSATYDDQERNNFSKHSVHHVPSGSGNQPPRKPQYQRNESQMQLEYEHSYAVNGSKVPRKSGNNYRSVEDDHYDFKNRERAANTSNSHQQNSHKSVRSSDDYVPDPMNDSSLSEEEEVHISKNIEARRVSSQRRRSSGDVRIHDARFDHEELPAQNSHELPMSPRSNVGYSHQSHRSMDNDVNQQYGSRSSHSSMPIVHSPQRRYEKQDHRGVTKSRREYHEAEDSEEHLKTYHVIPSTSKSLTKHDQNFRSGRSRIEKKASREDQGARIQSVHPGSSHDMQRNENNGTRDLQRRRSQFVTLEPLSRFSDHSQREHYGTEDRNSSDEEFFQRPRQLQTSTDHKTMPSNNLKRGSHGSNYSLELERIRLRKWDSNNHQSHDEDRTAGRQKDARTPIGYLNGNSHRRKSGTYGNDIQDSDDTLPLSRKGDKPKTPYRFVPAVDLKNSDSDFQEFSSQRRASPQKRMVDTPKTHFAYPESTRNVLPSPRETSASKYSQTPSIRSSRSSLNFRHSLDRRSLNRSRTQDGHFKSKNADTNSESDFEVSPTQHMHHLRQSIVSKQCACMRQDYEKYDNYMPTPSTSQHSKGRQSHFRKLSSRNNRDCSRSSHGSRNLSRSGSDGRNSRRQSHTPKARSYSRDLDDTVNEPYLSDSSSDTTFDLLKGRTRKVATSGKNSTPRRDSASSNFVTHRGHGSAKPFKTKSPVYSLRRKVTSCSTEKPAKTAEKKKRTFGKPIASTMDFENILDTGVGNLPGKGTIKRKRLLTKTLDKFNDGHVDDLFDENEIDIQNIRNLGEALEEDEEFSEPDLDFRTPIVTFKVTSPPSKIRMPNYVMAATPSEFNCKRDDAYLYRREKLKKSKHRDQGAMSSPKKSVDDAFQPSDVEVADASKNMNEILQRLPSDNDEDFSSDELKDYYFSDSNDSFAVQKNY